MLQLTWSEVTVGWAVSSGTLFSGLPEKSPSSEFPWPDSGSDEFVAAKMCRELGL